MAQELKAWIEKQRTKILSKEDHVIFDEVTKCLEAACYRAAYILGWTMLAESLKGKIYQLASLEDKNAESAVEEIEKLEKKGEAVDSVIRHKVSSCGIADASEASTLEFLWKQRCVFAHPYQKSPDKEEVKHLIDQAIKISLGKELMFTKPYLTELCNFIAETPHFIPVNKETVVLRAKTTLARMPEKLIPFLFKTLLSKLGETIKDDKKNRETTKLRWFTSYIIEETTIPLNDEGIWKFEMRGTKFPLELIVGSVNSTTWGKIPERVKEMMIAYYENEKEGRKLSLLKIIFKGLLESEGLEEEFRARLVGKLDLLSFNEAIEYYGASDSKFNRIEKELKLGNFEKQNDVIDYLKTPAAIDLVNLFNQEQQFQIGYQLAAAAKSNNYKSINFIPAIKLGQYNYSDFLKAGIALQPLFSSVDLFYFDWKKLNEIIKSLNELTPDASKKAYLKVTSFLEGKEIKGWGKDEKFHFDKFDGIVESIKEQIEWSEGHKELFEKMIEKIKNQILLSSDTPSSI